MNPINKYTLYAFENIIKLADLANEIGDYKCALENYSEALKLLHNIQEKTIQSIQKENELEQKINSVNEKKDLSQSILKFDRWVLTKSSFVKGNQCLKYLFLDKHKRNQKTPVSKELNQIFFRGHSFEDAVRKKDFPNGVNIKDLVGNFAYFNSYTNYLLTLDKECILYEATIIEEEVLVMCDILRKDKNGKIDIYEIKLNTRLNDAIKYDLYVQYLVCKKRFGHNLNSFNVILRTNEGGERWSVINKMKELEAIQETEDKINQFKKVLEGKEPDKSMGKHCYNPYQCEFIEYCKRTA